MKPNFLFLSLLLLAIPPLHEEGEVSIIPRCSSLEMGKSFQRRLLKHVQLLGTFDIRYDRSDAIINPTDSSESL